MTTTTEYPPSLDAAMAIFQADLPEARKTNVAKVETQKGPGYSYTYADLAELSQIILRRLGSLGVSWRCKPVSIEGRPAMDYKLVHVSGESDGGVFMLPVSGARAQDFGGVFTFFRRYLLCAVTGVAAEDDDDASAAEKSIRRRRTQPAQQQDGAPAAPQRTAQRSARPAEPPLPGERGYDKAGGPAMISDAQTRALMAAFRGADLGGNDARDARLARASAVVGRALGSSSELTAAEASKVIDDVKKFGASRSDPSDDPAAVAPPGTTWDPDLQEYIPDHVGVGAQ